MYALQTCTYTRINEFQFCKINQKTVLLCYRTMREVWAGENAPGRDPQLLPRRVRMHFVADGNVDRSIVGPATLSARKQARIIFLHAAITV